MVDNPQRVEIEAELDASATTRGIQAVGTEFSKLLNDARALEALTRSMFSSGGTLPRELEAFARTLQQVQTLPAQLAAIRRQTSFIASGGPTTSAQNAALSGVVQTLRADPIRQMLRLEQEQNRVLQAREEIFRRIRAVMPDTATARQISDAYRQALAAAGDMPERGTQAYSQWIARTRREVRGFETSWTNLQAAEAEKRGNAAVAAHQRQIQEIDRANRAQMLREQRERQQHYRELRRLYMQDVGAVMGARSEDERRTLARESLDRLGGYASRRGMDFDRDRLDQLYQDAEHRRYIQEASRRPARTPLSDDERIQRAYDQRNAFMNHNGGANRLMGRFGFVGDFAAVGAVMGTAAYAGRSTVQLQSELRQLQAITQATDLEMDQLRGTIFAVGQSTRYSTQQIAEAATVMGQAGYSAQQMEAALPSIANLATAAGAELNDTVATVTSVLSIFNLEIGRTEDVSNMMAAALNGSKLSFEQLALGLQYAGNVAADGGLQFEELVSALGAMADAGIRSGSTLGTGMRALIQELENPSEQFLEWLEAAGLTANDVDIRTQSLAGALQNLTAAGFDGAAAMNTFEIRAANAYTALSRNIDGMQDLQTEMFGTQAATDGAAVQMDSFAAQAQRLGNALTELTTVLGAPLLAFFQGAIGALASLLSVMADGGPVIQALVTAIGVLLALRLATWFGGLAVGLTGLNVGMMRAQIGMLGLVGTAGGMSAVLGTLTASVRAFTVALLANPMTWVVAGVTALTMALTAGSAAQARMTQAVQEHEAAANEAAAEVERYQTRMQELDDTIDTLIARHQAMTENNHMLRSAVEQATVRFGEWGLQLQQNVTDVDQLIDALVRLRAETSAQALQSARTQHTETQSLFEAQRDNFRSGQVGRDLQAMFHGRRDAGGRGGFFPVRSPLRSNPRAMQLMAKLYDGTISAMEIEEFRRIITAVPESQRTPEMRRVLEALSSSQVADMTGSRRSLDRLQGQISSYSLQASPEAIEVGNLVAGTASRYNQREEEIARMEPGRERGAAELALRRERQADFAELEREIRERARRLARDPEIQRGLGPQAAQAGMSLEDYIFNQLGQSNSGYAGLALAGGRGSAAQARASLPVVTQELRRVRRMLSAVDERTNPEEAAELRAELAELEALALMLRNPDMDPISRQEMLEASDEGLNAQGETAAERAARSSARIRSSQLGRDAEQLQRRIEAAGGVITTAASGSQWVRPVDSQYAINSGFGMRRHPVTGEERMHGGIDIAAPRGTEIRAAAAGTVRDASTALNGNAVTIRHADGSETTYLHMDTVLAASGYVEAGQVIGTVGSTGRSTGNHLHLQYRNAQGQLEDPSGLFDQAGPTSVTDNRAELQSMLDEWKNLRLDQLRQDAVAGGWTEGELADRIATFEAEAADYFEQVLSGNIQAVRQLLADRALTTADNVAVMAAAEMRALGGDLEATVADVQFAYDRALAAALEASDAEFRARGIDPAVAAEAQRRREELQAEFAAKSVDSVLLVLEAFFENEVRRMDREARAAQLQIDRERSRISQLSNPWGTRNIGDTQRALGERRLEELATTEARNGVNDLRARLGSATQYRDKIQGQLDAETDPAASARWAEQLDAANQSVRELAMALEDAEIAFEAMTGHAPQFQSATEALSAAWTVFLDQMNTGRSRWEDLADGLVGVFETAKTSFGTLVRDLLSGTKTMGEAFRDFTLSILQSMLDLAAEMLSREIIMWLIDFIGGQFGGGGGAKGGGGFSGKGGFSFGGGKGMALGGEIPGIRKMAGGGDIPGLGSIAPFRDGVLISAQPGEFLMRKSAVDMVGRDTLHSLNSAGNSRMSRMPTVGQATQREPDEVNVWVVTPDQKPQQLGKKDIVAAVADDIQTGGPMKKLVKAVAMGAM